MPLISEGISLKQLLGDGAEFEIKVSDQDEHQEDANNIEEAMLQFSNMECLGLQDEDDYIEGEPFDQLGLKMFDLVPNGVKKRIIREGHGLLPPDNAIVRIDYNAYLEYHAEPFDSSYVRKKRHDFTLNTGQALIGLDIGVQSMKIGEKAQFLLEPKFAYGTLGCLTKVPPNSRVLFEVELHEVIDSGAALSYDHLPEYKQAEFLETYKYCLALCARAKDKFVKGYVRDAIKEYNSAVAKLEVARLNDCNDQEKQEELLIRIYTNLLVSYVRVEEPKKGCINANKIFSMTKDTDSKLSAKIYYSHAKCLHMLGEFSRAKCQLRKAYNLEPKNPEIANEFILLEEAIAKSKKSEAKLAKAFVSNLSAEK